jgi:hypothetical protein
MMPFSIAPKRFKKYRDVLAGERNYQGLNLCQELIHQCRSIPTSLASQLNLYDHLRFGYRWSANRNGTGESDLAQQILVTGLTADHRDHCRRIQNQTGSPDSPYPSAASSSSFVQRREAEAGTPGQIRCSMNRRSDFSRFASGDVADTLSRRSSKACRIVSVFEVLVRRAISSARRSTSAFLMFRAIMVYLHHKYTSLDTRRNKTSHADLISVHNRSR